MNISGIKINSYSKSNNNITNSTIQENRTFEISSILEKLEKFPQRFDETKNTYGFNCATKNELRLLKEIRLELSKILKSLPEENLIEELVNTNNFDKKNNTLFYKAMNDLQKVAYLHNQLKDIENVNEDIEFPDIMTSASSKGYLKSYNKKGITIDPYDYRGLDNEIDSSFLLYRKLESGNQILYRFVGNNAADNMKQSVTELLDNKLTNSKQNPDNLFVVAIEVSDQTYTEPYIFKIKNGEVTQLLRSNSKHNHCYVELKFIPNDNQMIKNAFYVTHDGACSKYSDYALNLFACEMEKYDNDSTKAFDSIFSISNNNPDEIEIEKVLLLANFGYDATRIKLPQCKTDSQYFQNTNLDQYNPIFLYKKKVPNDDKKPLAIMDKRITKIYITSKKKLFNELIEILNNNPQIIANIQRLGIGGDFRNNNIEKLNNHKDLYSMRVNHKCRILFTIKNNDIILLKYDSEHKYNKAINKIENIKANIQKHPAGEYGLSSFEVIFDNDDIKQELHYINDKCMVFDTINQGKFLNSTYPLMLIGNAGTGKTVLLIQSIIQQIEKAIINKHDIPFILYVTKSKRLVDECTRGVFEHFKEYSEFDEIKKHVHIQVYDELIKNILVKNNDWMYVNEDYFYSWMEQQDKNVKKIYDIKTLYNECKTIHTCSLNNNRSLSDLYNEVGTLHSSIDNSKRSYVFKLYKDYINHLSKNKKIDPAFHDHNSIKFEHINKYLVMIDESQDFSGFQLNSLIKLAVIIDKKAQVCICINGNQCLDNSNPYIDTVLFDNNLQNIKQITLDKSYRNPIEINRLANDILAIKTCLLGGNPDKKFSPSPINTTESINHKGGIYIDINNSICSEELKNIAINHNSVVLVFDELQKKSAKEYFGKDIYIFTIAEFKGSEFSNVILFNVFNMPDSIDKQELAKLLKEPKLIYKEHGLKNKEITTGIQEQIIFFNKLYVAITRATKNLIIHEEKPNLLTKYIEHSYHANTKILLNEQINQKNKLVEIFNLFSFDTTCLREENLEISCKHIYDIYTANKDKIEIKDLVINNLLILLQNLYTSGKDNSEQLNKVYDLICQVCFDDQIEMIKLYKKIATSTDNEVFKYFKTKLDILSNKFIAYYNNNKINFENLTLAKLNDNTFLLNKQNDIYEGFSNDGLFIYSGTVDNINDLEKISGSGKCVCLTNFTSFEGKWQGKYYINGKLTTAKGDVYVGEFKDDKKNGQG
nr:hypothetical protein [Burkholderiales bacterium]